MFLLGFDDLERKAIDINLKSRHTGMLLAGIFLRLIHVAKDSGQNHAGVTVFL